jgi:OOP family OmpA-OmpF porin
MHRLSVLAVLLLGGCAALTSSAPQQRYVVFFQEWSAQIDTPAQQALQAAATAAQKYPALPVTVSGFADPVGSVAANKDISRLRAQVVIDTLVKDGVAPARIRRRSIGAVDFTLDSQESRRVEVVLGGK